MVFNKGQRALYRPQNKTVVVGRRLKDPESKKTYITVQEIGTGQTGEYRRSYQALESDLVPVGAPGGPTPLPSPISPGGPPEVPRVPRAFEPPSGVDPKALIWINDPDLLPDNIEANIKGIGMKSATKILAVRDEKYGGEYKALDEIPVPVKGQEKFFSLVDLDLDEATG
jgi:hypothetical protein